MKAGTHIRMVLLLCALLLSVSSQARERMLGLWFSPNTWEMMRFNADGTYALMHASRTRRARQAFKNGTGVKLRMPKQACSRFIWVPVQQGRYEVDGDRRPPWIDLVAKQKGRAVRVEGLFEFVDTDAFVMVTGLQRPATLSSRDFRIRFERATPCAP